MLVLTRKQKEQIRIGDEITVTILRINGSTVRVGIDAPRNIRVVRAELGPLEVADEKDSATLRLAEPTAQPSGEPASSARSELIASIRQHLAAAY